MTSQNQIECPSCGHDIDVNSILYQKLESELSKEFAEKSADAEKKHAALQQQIAERENELKKQEQALKRRIDEGIDAALAKERKQIIAQERSKAEQAQSENVASLQDELSAQNKKLKELNKAQSDVARLQREKDQLRDTLQLENEQKFSKQLEQERSRIQKIEAEKSELKIGEKEHVILQLTDQLKEAQRKAEQGSTQIQGEVQELAIESWLAKKFPLDTIEEIKKGAQGGDCLQYVNTRTAQQCGTIYYESKRTKTFQPAWIEKFKNDIRERNADIGVLVTAAMPAGMSRLGMKDGIWVCTFEEFKGLSEVLRQTIIMLNDATASQENRGEKMAMLYGFLTSNEFKLQVEGIVEGFTQMKADLEAEKRALQGQWRKREKQIEKVLLNTNHMYSSIRGIAGTAVQSVPMLELEGVEPD